MGGERGSKMMGLSTTRSVLKLTGNVINEVISFIVFLALDLLDVILCVVFKLLDFFIEAEWKSCYCSYSSAKDHAITSCGKILVSEKGESNKIIRLSSSKVQLEEISDTLFSRPSLVSEISKSTGMIKELNRLKIKNVVNMRSTFTINSTIIEMLQGKIGRQHVHDPIPRWSDCDCKTCSSWTNSSCKDTLYVRTQGPRDRVKEDVLFIHGFISSSSFWTETLFPNFSKETKSSYRLMAVDLLGFGRSPKPSDSLYTLREHIEMIERSVIDRHKVKSFHLVAHSLGCILALAIAVKHPGAIKSITLLAPPYFPVPKEEEGAASQYIMRRIAPRRVWPLISFGSSIVCWYEHIQRTICLLICKHHRLWEFLAKLVVRNRIRTYLVEAFMCHTHNAAWHTVHNVIFGSGSKVSKYLDTVRDKLNCPVNVFHGQDDELVPVECSYSVGSRVPRANVKVMKNIDHITIVVGRQKAFARELEEIWKNSSR